MTANPTDIFKAVATPPPELQRVLTYLAEIDSDSVITSRKSRTDVNAKKEAERDDLAATTIQISQQERLYQEYREQSQQINNAIDLALADAATPEERQEILEYQAFVQEIDEDIEQKREAGTLTHEDIEEARHDKIDNMPEAVRQHMPNDTNTPTLNQTEISNLERDSNTSFANSNEGSTFENLPDMNGSFQAAVSDTNSNDPTPTGPENAPLTPSDLSKFTI